MYVSNKQLSKIKLLVTDVDGVMTDGGMYYTEDGNEFKKFNTRDGTAIQLLRKRGIKTAIITGEDTTIVNRRAEKLNIDSDLVLQNVDNKMLALKWINRSFMLDYSEIAYIGDDINDLPVLKKVGFAFCPRDAVEEVQKICFVSTKNGGNGVIRDFYELMKKYVFETYKYG